MENAFFIRSNMQNVQVERFHICTWEFTDDTSLVEFGLEINSSSLEGLDSISIDLYIPWITDKCETTDLYNKLKGSENSRFIFNDSVSNVSPLDTGANLLGVVHEFGDRNKLCILPIEIEKNLKSKKLTVTVSLDEYRKKAKGVNAYIRLSTKPSFNKVSLQKKGIGKSTIIYDLKINEERNIPDSLLAEFRASSACRIQSCFCFNIVPNCYDINFFESEHLRNVRTLEYDSFRSYLNDDRIKQDELMAVFLKKSGQDGYSFFTIYSQEMIGATQFAVAIIVNIACAFLFALPGMKDHIPHWGFIDFLFIPKYTFWIAISSVIILLLYLFCPIQKMINTSKTYIVDKFKGEQK